MRQSNIYSINVFLKLFLVFTQHILKWLSNLYIYVCVCVCVCVYMCVCMCVCMCVYIYIRVRLTGPDS